MEDNKIKNDEVLDTLNDTETKKDGEAPLDKNVKLLSPTQMVLRRFFRSKLSIIGLVMIVGLFLFSFVGPLFFADLGTKNEMGVIEYDPNDGKWGEIELDESGMIEYTTEEYTVVDDNGNTVVIRQTV